MNRNLYIISGVVDPDKSVSDARRYHKIYGDTATLHYHSHSEPCEGHEHKHVPERTSNANESKN